jgi:hypothetical protein
VEQQLEKFSVPEPNSGCWLWTGYTLPAGHGQVSRGGRMRLAHRVAYEHWVGPIPEGMNLNHQCDTPSCINPAHLRVGTQAENVHEAVARGIFRQKPPRTECRNGHKRETYGGRLRCRTCTRRWNG